MVLLPHEEKLTVPIYFCLECHGYNCPPQLVYDGASQEVHNSFSIIIIW